MDKRPMPDASPHGSTGRADNPDDFDLDECTHCGGQGDCCDGSDPLGDCPDEAHACHACGGSGQRADQVIF